LRAAGYFCSPTQPGIARLRPFFSRRSAFSLAALAGAADVGADPRVGFALMAAIIGGWR
jgi:hypothetical protein